MDNSDSTYVFYIVVKQFKIGRDDMEINGNSSLLFSKKEKR